MKGENCYWKTLDHNLLKVISALGKRLCVERIDIFNTGMFSASPIDLDSKDRMNATQNSVFQKGSPDLRVLLPEM